MSHPYDPGYPRPWSTLVVSYPGPEVYPPEDFRLEWGPIFHRGRLDGSARVVVIGQDPGAHENIVRRILVGEAGQRIQGFLAKLGITSSYVMVNAFLYSAYGQGGAERHRDDPAVIEYRHRWLDTLFDESSVEAVVAFGGLADDAFSRWKGTPAGAAADVAYRHVIHPTYPESASASGQMTKAEAMARMLAGWNVALEELAPRVTPDAPTELVPYGSALMPHDSAPIPERDLPVGLPSWMRAVEAWALRRGEDDDEKRATLVVTVPRVHRPWPPQG